MAATHRHGVAWVQAVLELGSLLYIFLQVQVLSEMIISNESNILTSRVLSHFNRSRQLLFTIKLRYKDLEKVQHLLPSAAAR